MNSTAAELLHGCPDDSDCPPEWHTITEARQNVLLESPRDAAESAVGMLEPYLSQPIIRRRPGEPLELGTGSFRTLIVEEVAALPAEEQTTLREWIDRQEGRVQVISTTCHPLFSLVTRGLFDEGLYYRLNVVRLVSGTPSTSTGS